MNNLLIPVIEMRRGTKYTFRVNGGDNPDSNAEFHPFYLTTNPTGGYATLSPEERAMETVFAGIKITEESDQGVVAFESTATAPICSYSVTDETRDVEEDGDFQDYFNSLDTSCRDDSTIISEAAVFEFTPNEETPDEIYYQCVTHRNLGWKIMVLDAEEVVEEEENDDAAGVETSATSSGTTSFSSGSIFGGALTTLFFGLLM